MDAGAFLRYWALTFAVFVFYVFALIVASLDTVESLRETVRKRRAERKPIVLDPNPLASRTVAGTILPGPGQVIAGKQEWVARLAEEIVRRVNPHPPVRTLVLEDSKGHPVVHFSNGTRLETYRFDRDQVESAVAGDAARVREVAERLERHLIADFLGREDARPPRATELTREAAAKAAAKAEPAAAAAAADPAPAPAASAVPADPAPAPAAADPESMSREERLAAARAKAEALRAARQAQKPPS
jgi:predicted Zn-dependent protease